MKKIKIDKNNILILVIIICSFANLFNVYSSGNYLSLVVTVVGLAGVFLYFKDQRSFRYFVWVWISAQAIIIHHSYFDATLNENINKPIFDLSQMFKLQFGFVMGGNDSTYSIDFNILTILYALLYRNLKINSLFGKSMPLLVYKGNNDIEYGIDLRVVFKRRINLDGDDNWLLGDFNEPIFFNENKYDRVVMQADKGLLTGVFRLVGENQLINERSNASLSFERVDWLRFD